MLVHRFAILAALGTLALAAGCSDNPPPKTPASAANGAAAPQNGAAGTSSEVSPSSPTATAVHIDDAILKACGIAAPKAFFAFDSAKLRPGDMQPLDEVATCFVSGPLKGRSLKLVGHADPRGEAEYNMVLGQSRADQVGSYLTQKGMEKAHVESSSRGAMDATGVDDKGWSADRRVDVLLAQ